MSNVDVDQLFSWVALVALLLVSLILLAFRVYTRVHRRLESRRLYRQPSDRLEHGEVRAPGGLFPAPWVTPDASAPVASRPQPVAYDDYRPRAAKSQTASGLREAIGVLSDIAGIIGTAVAVYLLIKHG